MCKEFFEHVPTMTVVFGSIPLAVLQLIMLQGDIFNEKCT